jgi:metal-sulfur cluster biosynthetic enzyme
MIGRAQVLAALAAVHDPELDEPITTLGFVGSCVVSTSGDVDVHLRLPTSQCAPNFAYLMVADARDAVAALPEVGEVTVVLDEHYTGDEINGAVAARSGFAGAFPGEGAGELDALRELFQRKALLARQGRVCQALMDGGVGAAAVVALRVADLPDSADAMRCVALRRELGLRHGPDAPALIAGDGGTIPVKDLRVWLRRASLVGLSLESNGGLCRSLLRVRYGVHDPTEERAFA